MKLLTNEDAERLENAGFTPWEIGQFSEGTDPSGNSQPQVDLNKIPWIEAMDSRRRWKDQLVSEGWTEQQFQQNIYNQYNKNPKQSPWDFLKSEYKPPQKTDFRSTIEATKRVRNFKSSVRRHLRVERRKIEKNIQSVSTSQEEQEYFSGTLGETIRRLNREGR